MKVKVVCRYCDISYKVSVRNKREAKALKRVVKRQRFVCPVCMDRRLSIYSLGGVSQYGCCKW